AEATGAAARDRGFLTLDDLVVLADWKSVRIRPRIARNDDGFVREVTRVSLSAASSAAGERLRIEVLTLLEGVGWPMASVILHFCHRDPYPILDVRALWSLGIPEGEPKSGYDFALWLR